MSQPVHGVYKNGISRTVQRSVYGPYVLYEYTTKGCGDTVHSDEAEVGRLQQSMLWKSRNVRKERPLLDLTSSNAGFDTRTLAMRIALHYSHEQLIESPIWVESLKVIGGFDDAANVVLPMFWFSLSGL